MKLIKVPEPIRTKGQRLEYDRQTTEMHLVHDAIFAIENHRYIYEDFRRHFHNTFKATRKRLLKEIWDYIDWKRGRLGHGEDLLSAKNEKDGACACIVIASGPSLNKALPILKHWKGGIICSASQYSTLVYHGVHPDYVEAFDTKTPPQYLKVPERDYEKTTLIARVDSDPRLLREWKGRTLYSLMGSTDQLYSDILPAAYQWIGARSYPFGCTPPTQISHATLLGYGHLYLAGMDLCYNDDQLRLEEYYWHDEWVRREWTITPHNAENRGDMITEEGYKTSCLHEFYREQILSMCWLEDVTITNCSPGLLDRYLPNADIAEVIKEQGRNIFPSSYVEQRRKNIGAYLFSRGYYWCPTSEGRFVPLSFDSVAEIFETAEALPQEQQQLIRKDVATLAARYERTKGVWSD